MSARDLAVLYVLAGVPLGVMAYRRADSARLASAIGTAVLWPLWAPFSVLASAEPARGAAAADVPPSPRLERGLATLGAAARDGLVNATLPADVRAVADHLRARIGAIDAELAATREAPSAPAIRARTEARLAELRAETAASEEALLARLDALAARLVLARFEAPSPGDVDALAAELEAELEALGEGAAPGPAAG